MQALDAILSATPATDPWPARRQRTDELASRYPHAADILRLYRAVLDPQEEAFRAALSSPSPRVGEGQGGVWQLATFAVQHVLPGIIDATIAAGPPVLRDGVIALFASADLEGLMRRWLDGETLLPVETYLARTCVSPLLEALAQSPSPPVDPFHCPACGGLPQLSYHSLSGEPLVSGPRYLLCSRCSQSWIFSRMTCASCGESNGTRLPIYQEEERFPHARVDGCATCRRYLLTFDLRRDSRAVPIVDELACLPLDLYARDQGLTKISPNLMGN